MPSGLLFAFCMAVNIVWVGAFLFGNVISALRDEARR